MASRELIEGLLAQGYTYSSIGKAIDRDSSLVSQVAKGKKPGRNLEASLEALLKSGLVETLPPRRTTRSGTQARVRKGGPVSSGKAAKEIPGILDKKGRIIHAELDGLDAKDIWKMLSKIRKDGGVLAFTVTAHGFKKYRQLAAGVVEGVRVFPDGIEATDFHLANGDIQSTLITYLIEEEGVEKVKSLSNIQMSVLY